MSLGAIAGHKSSINSACLSSDGSTLYTSSYDSTVKIWDVEKGTLTSTIEKYDEKTNPDGHKEGVAYLALDCDGKLLATVSGKLCRIWDCQTLKLLKTLDDEQGNSMYLSAVAFSPTSQRLATGGEKCVRIWSTADFKCLKALWQGSEEGGIDRVTFSMDGRKLASGSSEGHVRVYDAASDSYGSLTSFKNQLPRMWGMISLCWSPDLKSLACGYYGRDKNSEYTDRVSVWSLESGKIEFTCDGATACFSPDGKQLVTGGVVEDTKIRVYDVKTRHPITTLIGHSNWVSCLDFTADHKSLISCSGDKTVRIWKKRI